MTDKVRNTTVFISVSSIELTHTVHDQQLHSLGHILRNTRYPHIITLCTIPASSCHNKTWLSLIKLHRQADEWWTSGGVTSVNLWSHVLIYNHPT